MIFFQSLLFRSLKIIFHSLWMSLLLFGCVSLKSQMEPPLQSQLPPQISLNENMDLESLDIYLKQQIQNEQAINKLFWLKYKRAQLNKVSHPEISCQLYKELSRNLEFPIKDIALIRSYEVCLTENSSSKDNFPDHNNQEEWLRPLVIDMEISHYRKLNHTEKLYSLLTEQLSLKELKIPKEKKQDLYKEVYDLAIQLHINSEEAQKLKEKIYRISPRTKPQPQKEDFLSIAKDYRHHREFDKSIKFYNKIIHSPSFSYFEKALAFKGLRRVYRLMNNKQKVLRTTKQLATYSHQQYKKHKKISKFKQFFLQNKLLLARTYWTYGYFQKAQSTAIYVLKHCYSRCEEAPSIYLLLGRMHDERKQYKQALYWFKQGLSNFNSELQPIQNVQLNEYQEDLLWHNSWDLLKIHKYTVAIENLKDLVSSTTNDFHKYKYMYWLAIAQAKNLSFKDSNETLKNLLTEDPLGYYGLLAQRELKLPIQIRPSSRHLASLSKAEEFSPSETTTNTQVELDNELKTHLEPFQTIYDYNRWKWLTSLSENDLALGFLNFQLKTLSPSQKTDEFWVQVFKKYAKTGNYLELFSQMGRISPEKKKTFLLKNPYLLFPQPFSTWVNDSSQKYGIPIEYIYAIMRQESAFNPKARSYMDAYGLLQLLPRVALKKSEEFSIPYSQPEDLYEPKTIIPLGTSFLRELWDKYHGRIILSTAAYNANEEAIQSWLNTRFEGDSITFIEDIPYEETRNYVKLVLRNFIFYQLLTSQKSSIEFPEWVLKI